MQKTSIMPLVTTTKTIKRIYYSVAEDVPEWFDLESFSGVMLRLFNQFVGIPMEKVVSGTIGICTFFHEDIMVYIGKKFKTTKQMKKRVKDRLKRKYFTTLMIELSMQNVEEKDRLLAMCFLNAMFFQVFTKIVKRVIKVRACDPLSREILKNLKHFQGMNATLQGMIRNIM